MLDGANLHGADLTVGPDGGRKPAQGLTARQLAHAVLDDATRLPTGLSDELINYHQQRLYHAPRPLPASGIWLITDQHRLKTRSLRHLTSRC